MAQLAEVNPSLTDVLASCGEWARDEEDYWLAAVRRFEKQHVIPHGEAALVRTSDIRPLPIAAQRRILRALIERVRGHLRSIDFRHIEAIRSLIEATEGSGRMQLPGLDIYRSFDWLRFAPIGFDTRMERDFSVPLAVPGVTEVAGRGIALTMERETVESVHYNERVYNDEVNALDQEKCAGPLQLRNWRPGDRLRPVGHSGSLGYSTEVKIKTLFQEHRVPLWERRHWPVIVRDSSILWTRRFGAAAEFAAGPASSQILRVRETGESNPGLGTSTEAGSSAEGRFSAGVS
jgi:tRNA(Ile)-lysidine synthase